VSSQSTKTIVVLGWVTGSDLARTRGGLISCRVAARGGGVPRGEDGLAGRSTGNCAECGRTASRAFRTGVAKEESAGGPRSW